MNLGSSSFELECSDKDNIKVKVKRVFIEKLLMKVFIFLFILVPFSAHAKRKILVSYFASFGGSTKNHTEEVAKLIQGKIGSSTNDLEIVLCPLGSSNTAGVPVTFYAPYNQVPTDKGLQSLKGPSAFEVLRSCHIAHPDAQQVISLGEGACEVHVEGVGKNTMTTSDMEIYRDNGGNLIPGQASIDPKGPLIVKTDNVNILALCLEQENLFQKNTVERNLLQYSNDAGDYLCNNLTYNFQMYLNRQRSPVSYSFIHIPPGLSKATDQGCKMGNYKKTLENKSKILSSENFSDLIATQIKDFLKVKDIAINEIIPNDELNQSLENSCQPQIIDAEFKNALVDIKKELQKKDYKKLLSDPKIQNCLKKKINIQNQASIPENGDSPLNLAGRDELTKR